MTTNGYAGMSTISLKTSSGRSPAPAGISGTAGSTELSAEVIGTPRATTLFIKLYVDRDCLSVNANSISLVLDHYTLLLPDETGGPHLLLQPVAEDRAGKNRMHILARRLGGCSTPATDSRSSSASPETTYR